MKVCNKYDFVYILKDTPKNEELKYSLRSIEAYAANPKKPNLKLRVGGRFNMKLIYKHDNEVIDVIFEDCDGNLRVINKNDPTKEGEYDSIKAFLKDFKDIPDYKGSGNPKYAKQYRYAKTEKGKQKKREANKRYYLRRKAK